MKRLRFMAACLLISGACTENIVLQKPDGSAESGSVCIALTADERAGDVTTKAEAELPSVDDFRVAIYKTANQMRLYNDSYANTKGREIKLNAGEYRLVAQHGDSLGCGFDKAYYLAEPSFTIEGYNTQVEAEAKLANVRMAVEYGETITEVYSDFYTVVKHKVHKGKEVKFIKGETRCGYIPGGEVVLQIYVLDDDGAGNTTWKYTETAPLTYNPNDFVLFSVTTADASGKLSLSITVDSEVETEEKEVEIPAFTVPQPAPAITPDGWDETTKVHYVTEGVKENHTATANFVARGALAHCYVKVESEYLSAQGVPAEVDFVNLTPEQETVLKSVGFDWDPDMLGNRSFSYVDFTGVINHLNANVPAAKEDKVIAKFTVKVVDKVNKTAEDTFTVTSLGITPAMAVNSYDVWARRIVNPTTTINRGNISLLKIQYSKDNTSWSDFAETPSTNSLTATYSTVAVEPATKYYLRAIYNNNTTCSSTVQEFTTEAAAQLPNSGFEDWTTQTHQASGHDVTWFRPWGGQTGSCWDVNSKKTMPDKTDFLNTSSYLEYKCRPTVAYSNSGVTGKAAVIATIKIGSGANGGGMGTTGLVTAAGELFIGSADDSGNHASEGYSFVSRPSAVRLMYKYHSYNSETFAIDVVLKNGSTEIAKASVTKGGASSWTALTIPLTVLDATKKATSIYISMRSSTAGSPGAEKSSYEIAGNNQNACLGSILTIDDMELIYE